MASTIGAGLVGDDRLGCEALLSKQCAHLRVSVIQCPTTNAAVAPTGNPTFFAPLMALIANARRFSPESARPMRLSTHYLGTEDRYLNLLRYPRE
jgi:hypothetical protein